MCSICDDICSHCMWSQLLSSLKIFSILSENIWKHLACLDQIRLVHNICDRLELCCWHSSFYRSLFLFPHPPRTVLHPDTCHRRSRWSRRGGTSGPGLWGFCQEWEDDSEHSEAASSSSHCHTTNWKIFSCKKSKKYFHIKNLKNIFVFKISFQR